MSARLSWTLTVVVLVGSASGALAVQQSNADPSARRLARNSAAPRRAGSAATANEGDQRSILFINYQNIAIPSAIVPLPIKSDLPIRLVTSAGKELPVLRGEDSSLAVVLGLGARASVEAVPKPAEDWATPMQIMRARSDQTSAQVFNGVLTVRFSRKTDMFDVYLGPDVDNGVCLLKDLSLHKNEWGKPDFKEEISAEGWRRIYRMESAIERVEAKVSADAATIVIHRRFLNPAAAKVSYKEVLTLPFGKPVITYRAYYNNRSDETFYFSGRDNAMHADLAGALAGGYRVLRGDGKPLAEGRLAWIRPRWVSIEVDSGFGLGCSVLKPGISYKFMHDSQRISLRQLGTANRLRMSLFGYVHGAKDIERWAVIYPNEEEYVGGLFQISLPGQDLRRIMAANWDRLRAGEPMAFPSPIAAVCGGNVSVYPEVKGVANAAGAPQCWHVIRGQALAHGKGMELIAPEGKFAAAQYFTVSFEEPFYLDLDVDSISTATRLEVSLIDAADGAVIGKVEAAEPGQARTEISVGRAAVPVQMRLTLTGGRPAQAVIRSVALLPEPPAPPVAIAPVEGMDITDVAVSFLWSAVPGCKNYEIQIARSLEFKGPIVLRGAKPGVDARTGLDGHLVCPQLLKPGAWYWRVRGIRFGMLRQPGQWSQVRTFRVNDQHPSAEPIREISPQKPLFVFRDHWTYDPSAYAKDIPEDLREYVVVSERPFRRKPGGGRRTMQEFCKQAKASGLKFLVEDTYAPADTEWIFQHCANVIGLAFNERHFWYWRDDEVEVMQRLHVLAAKYGRVIVWADGFKFSWMEMAKEERFVTGKNAPYFVPLLKPTTGSLMPLIQGQVMGYWASGLSENFGVQVDPFYWASAGFRFLNEDLGPGRGDQKLHPPAGYLQQWLYMMMLGATVFKNECDVCWDGNGRPTELWTRYYMPFIRGVLKNALLLPREEALKAAGIAVVTVFPQDWTGEKDAWSWGPASYRMYAPLFKEAYGVTRIHGEYFPDNTRYRMVPLIIPEAAHGVKGLKVVTSNDLQTPENIHRILSEAQPKRFSGDALVLIAAGRFGILNSNENRDIDQTYEIPLNGKFVKKIAGTICVQGYIMGRLLDDGSLWWQANNSIVNKHFVKLDQHGRVVPGTYEYRPTTMKITCRRRPVVRVAPAGAKVAAEWNASTKTLTVTVSHRDGAVDVYVSPPR